MQSTAAAKKSREIYAQPAHVLHREEGPAGEDHGHGVDVGQGGRQLLQDLSQPQALQQHPRRVVEPPEQEVPPRPVPDAGEEPHDQDVAHPLGPGHAVPPQREIDVLPEPGGQGDVPALPKLYHRAGNIGVVEVLQEVEAEHLPQADGHVAVAGEIEIDLERVGRDAQPRAGEGQLLTRKGPVPELANSVGQQDLLCHAHGEALDPGGEFLQVLPPALQLFRHGFVADDGARDELGKEGDIGAEGDHVFLHRGVPAVDVDRIAHGLEGVKADADGQHQPRPCKAGAKKGVDVFVQKAGVFKEHQEGEIQHHRRNEGAAGLPALRVLQMLFYMQGQQPVDKGGGDK